MHPQQSQMCLKVSGISPSVFYLPPQPSPKAFLAQSNLGPTCYLITLPRLGQRDRGNALELAWLHRLHSTVKSGYKETLFSEEHCISLIIVVKFMEYNYSIANTVINKFFHSLDTLFYCGFTAQIWWVFFLWEKQKHFLVNKFNSCLAFIQKLGCQEQL